jgi:hypothetical protein
LQVGDDGDAAEVEGVLARPLIAGLVALDGIDAGQRVLDGGPVPELGAPRGLVLLRPERLE